MVLVLVLVPELVEESVPVLVLVQATAAADQVKDWVWEQEFLVEAEE
jgi:hypothetical protein